ncbi:MAG: hypothetical protein WCP86_09090 [bacterium]
MIRTVGGIFLAIMISASALADEPATGFWVVEVAALKKAIAEYGALQKIDATEMSMIAECSGRFKGKECDFHFQSARISFSITAIDDGAQLKYKAVLGWGGVKRAALDFNGVTKLEKIWSLPNNWETSQYLILFKRLNLKQ